MRRFPKALWLIAVGVTLCSCATQRALKMHEVPSELEGAFTEILSYEFGKPNAPVVQISNAVNVSQQSPAQRRWLEDKLLDIVNSSAPRDARDFACRQLSVIGTKRSVPSLAALLVSDEMSDSARYALERIPDKAVESALIKALRNANSTQKQGILNSLGARESSSSISAIRSALRDEDKAVVTSALYALAGVGNTRAARALVAFRSRGFTEMPHVYGDSCLICAERLAESKNYTAPFQIYVMLVSKHKTHKLMPEEIRSAALRGMYALGGMRYNLDMSSILFGMLHDTDRLGPVAELIRDSPELFPAADLAEVLQACDPSAQLILLGILADRGDPSVSGEIVEMTKSEDSNVRRAAIEALVKCGNVSAVDTLIHYAAFGARPEQDAARSTLSRIQGEEINSYLVSQIPESVSPESQVELFRALVNRVATETKRELLKMLESSDVTIQREAFRSLASLASPDDISVILQNLLEVQDDGVRREAERTVATLCEKHPDPTDRTKFMNEVQGVEDTSNVCSLLRILSRLGGDDALACHRNALKSEETEIRETALRNLSEWLDVSALDDLMDLARTLDEGVHKTLAMRGAARLLGLAKDRDMQERVALSAELMNLAGNVGERKLVLSLIGKLPDPKSLEMVTVCLEDPELLSEAAAALFELANPLKETNSVELLTALDRIVSATETDDNTRKKAVDVLVEFDRYADHILSWEAAGPYSQQGSNGAELLDVAFAPEQADQEVEWKIIGEKESELHAWYVDLEEYLGKGDHQAAYLRTLVWSPEQQSAQLEIGSDDAVKVCLNGEVVHSKNVSRACTPNEDKIAVELQEGWNRLLLKVVNYTADWGVSARIRNPKGLALEGIAVSLKETKQ